MQSYKDQELIETKIGSREELLKSLLESQDAKATHHVIGSLLNNGDEVTIRGLVWIVDRVNDQAGWMRLRLKDKQLDS